MISATQFQKGKSNTHNVLVTPMHKTSLHRTRCPFLTACASVPRARTDPRAWWCQRAAHQWKASSLLSADSEELAYSKNVALSLQKLHVEIMYYSPRLALVNSELERRDSGTM